MVYKDIKGVEEIKVNNLGIIPAYTYDIKYYTEADEVSVEYYTYQSVYGDHVVYSDCPGGYMTFKFYGSVVGVIFLFHTFGGIANIYIDGQLVKEVDTYSPIYYVRPVLIATNLQDTEHEIKIECSGNKNASSAGIYIRVYGIVVDKSRNPQPNQLIGLTRPATADAMSKKTTGLLTLSFLYGYNGSSWDRLRSDANKYLYVNLGADSVGLATESTLSSINSKITTCDTSNISGTVTSQLQGYQSGVGQWVNLEADSNNYLYVNLGATTITLPVDVQANLMQQLDYTTTALGAGATYTGDSVEVDKYTRLCGTVIADQDGTIYIDQSPDGTNWDYTSSFNFTANDGLAFSVEVVCPYARMRVTNTSSSDQTYLRAYLFGKVMN